MGSHVGALRRAASRIGISFAEYQRRTATGEKWCSGHRAFHLAAAFTRDRSRFNGLDASCRAVRSRRHRRALLRLRYGLTPEDYDALMRAQAGRCAACDREFSGLPHIDHDHRTGTVRGLLCFNCNVMVGNGHDDPAVLRRGAAYLERHR